MGAVMKGGLVGSREYADRKAPIIDMYVYESDGKSAIALLGHGEIKRMTPNALESTFTKHYEAIEQLMNLGTPGAGDLPRY